MKKLNRISFLLTIFLLSILSISAQKKFVSSVAKQDATYLTINDSDTTKNYLDNGGSQTVSVNTNLTLNAKSSETWCKPTVSATTNEVTITVDANTENSTRTAEVTIYGKDNRSAVINVIQLGSGFAFLVNETDIYVDQYVETFTLGVTSNIEFSFETPAWITGPAETLETGYKEYTFTLAPFTTANTQRNDNIVIKATTITGIASITIPVTQKNIGYPRFAVISDIHFGNTKGEGPMVKVPKALKNITSHGKLDALFVVGDLTEDGTTAQYSQLVQVFTNENNFTNPIDTILYMMGNHDNYTTQSNYVNGLKPLNNGDAYPFDQYIVIKGYPFITISQRNRSNTDAVTEANGTGAYPKAVQDTLRSWLAKAALECPGKPIFVFTHVPTKFTCYSSWPGEGDGTSWPTWSMKVLNPILNEYPQAVVFGGHSHFPIGDPRSIHQGVNPNSSRQNFYTGINVGSTTYSEIHRPSVSEGIHPDKYDYVTEGLILSVQENGDVKIQRYDTYRNEEMRPNNPWMLETPHDGSKFKYADIRDNDETNVYNLPIRTGLPAPIFETSDAITTSNITMNSVDVTFPQATDDEYVFRYRVCIKNQSGTIIREVFQFSYFYLNSAMPSTLTVNLSGLAPNTTYTAEVTAYDSYDNISTALSQSFTTTNDSDPANQPPARTGSWLFDDTADLLNATIGNNLVPATETTSGGVTVRNSAAEANIVSINGPNAANKAITVPRLSLLKLEHGKTTTVDTYTIMYDIKISSNTSWHSLLQPYLLNNSDASLFINTSGYLGLNVAGFGYGSTTLQTNTWHRVVFVVNAGVPTVYLNGSAERIGTYTGDRFKLAAEAVLLFADNDGETQNIDVAEIAFWDSALTSGQVANLGTIE